MWELFLFGGTRPAEFQTGVRLVVDGTLAIASDIAPLTQLNREASVDAVRAEVKTAPTGDDIDLEIYVNAVLWMSLTIPAGSTSVTANAGQIAGAAAIGANQNIRLDVTSVGTRVPGRIWWCRCTCETVLEPEQKSCVKSLVAAG